MIRLLVVGSLLLFSAELTWADKTTPVPPSNTSKPAVAFIIIPGAQIGADQYLNLGRKIQTDSEYSVWLATVGGWLANLVNPLQLPSFIDDAIQQLRGVGLPKDAPIFLAAHSLGGVFLDMHVRSNPKAYSGIVLYSSYISKSVKLEDYPVPVLTASGDQDGMCRMTRIIMDYGQLKNYTARTPVVIVPGLNHSLVASGQMPPLVQENDLIADCTEEEAHSLLSNITNSFLSLNGPVTNKSVLETANDTLKGYYKSNSDIAMGYLQAVELDAGGFPSWAQLTAVALSDITSDDYQLNVEGVPGSETAFISGKVSSTVSGEKTLNMSVPMYNVMPFNPADISLSQQAPVELFVKTLSKKMMHQQLPNAMYAEIPRRCNDSNTISFGMSVLSVPYDYQMRYQRNGRQLEFKADTVSQSETSWLATDVSWTYTKDNTVEVVSPYYETDDILMCKVMTLSRVIEWMLIDAFKKH